MSFESGCGWYNYAQSSPDPKYRKPNKLGKSSTLTESKMAVYFIPL